MNESIPRPEHPNPQKYRENWQNLNGKWEFAFDFGNSGQERGMHLKQAEYPRSILVPFAPESNLSGIGHEDFVSAVWYRRQVYLDQKQLAGRVLLHLGAVDHDCQVWLNETPVGRHQGGYSSFSLDISEQAIVGENTLVIAAFDDLRSGRQPAGKQSDRYDSYQCSYTRTTGIWQTVWLEFVPETYIKDFSLRPDFANQRLDIMVQSENVSPRSETRLTACLIDPHDGRTLAQQTVKVPTGMQTLSLQTDANTAIEPWQPGQPKLYDVQLKLEDDCRACVDQIKSYCGFRDLSWNDGGLHVNGKPVFQRLILDQGFYPEGIYTAPDDESLRRDIELSQNLGFNGARLHQKVFEPRFLYWADRLGYMVWGEQGSWQLDISRPEAMTNFLPEWTEVILRDRNHPAIIGWCPFNETWDFKGRRQCDDVIRQVYELTRLLDPYRPVIDTSGNYHVKTDFFDVHDYEQDPQRFAATYGKGSDLMPHVTYPDRQQYRGEPYWVSEYGGAWWNPHQKAGWGYGNNPKSEMELGERYCKLTQTLMQNPKICGFCYTQLTDVEQEQNGLYFYDRQSKFSDSVYAKIRSVNQEQAAFEKR